MARPLKVALKNVPGKKQQKTPESNTWLWLLCGIYPADPIRGIKNTSLKGGSLGSYSLFSTNPSISLAIPLASAPEPKSE
ncbi:hypothetical protein [Halomonas halocynthiae]|uniref:hypothetical protein n=1 Tax=Halomonas halocynthiae TaxID=176290 RepID=UPI0012EB7B4C|nr:hypothetical protein [Halomonas halocynthiae]